MPGFRRSASHLNITLWRDHFGTVLVETPNDFGCLGDLPLTLQELQAERPHGCQFMEEFALGLLGREAVEQIGQLNAMTHDPIVILIFQIAANEQTIIDIVQLTVLSGTS